MLYCCMLIISTFIIYLNHMRSYIVDIYDGSFRALMVCCENGIMRIFHDSGEAKVIILRFGLSII